MEKLYKRIEELLAGENDEVLISIEGGAGSGKSTLAAALKERYGAEVYHMDDFFLPPSMRTEERLAEPGGNVHYERFFEEVIEGIFSYDSFSYGIFDCKEGRITRFRDAYPNRLHIIEGAYSAHPFMEDVYDLRVFLEVDEEIQKKRILEREGEKAELFFTRWIPLEKRYFEAFQIKEKSDIVL